MKSFLSDVLIALLFSVFSYTTIIAQDYKILESDETHVKLELDFTNKFSVSDVFIDRIKFTSIKDINYPLQKPGDPFLPTRFYQIGIPQNTKAVVRLIDVEREVYNDKFIISTPDSINQPFNELRYNQNVYGENLLFPIEQSEINSDAVFRFIKIASLSVAPFQFNPVQRTLIFNKKLIVQVDFVQDRTFADILSPVTDKMTEDLVKTKLINPEEAITFLGKKQSTRNTLLEKYWYDPNKDYYKIYLNEKGVYRITYDQLISIGISPLSGIQDGNLEIYNNGVSLPIDIIDTQQDDTFNSGDYFQFVGSNMTPSPYAGQNIYNKTNVYWFSYQADSINSYKPKNGYPTNTWPKVISNQNTIHYEKDLIFERLGYASSNLERDYWFWDKSEFRGGQQTHIFTYEINHLDSNINTSLPQARVRLNLMGINLINCSPGHSGYLRFNSQKIGNFTFPGSSQQSYTFEKDFVFGFGTTIVDDSIHYRWGYNYFEVGIDSPSCLSSGDDINRINWLEFDYWRYNRVNGKHYIFKSPPNQNGRLNFYLWQWEADNMKVYIPQKSEMIKNPFITNDPDKGVYFLDTTSTRTEYFLVSEDYYLPPDSIKKDSHSDLRNTQNGADYIIITHPDFLEVAERLAVYRSNNIHGVDNPRVKVIDVNDVYDEFSDGLMDPLALQYFTKYAFENWQVPSPSYIVLLGDMSFDYRGIYENSRPNFIPSIPYQSILYGQAPSDNSIVTVAGNDLVPDLATGRISCESVEEANLLVDKIINYPADIGKEWKQNVLLLSSGLSEEDENNFKFNDRNMFLANNYIDPAGIKSTKVFRYPNKPEYIQYQGSGPDIRREIDKGTVMVNYYGHGGGEQWDLIFTNDDILALNNGNRLPFVVSVTCYTAHYDNQEIFGEIFNSISGKGSIAFFGSSGVTFWPTTAIINQDLFEDVFRNKHYVIGDAILNAKSNPGYGTMLALLTLLGDPALELALPYNADFVIKPSDISIYPNNPLIDDTVKVYLKLKNLGRSFIGDSVKLELYHTLISDSTLIGVNKLGSFGEEDSTSYTWIPKVEGLINLIAVINSDQAVTEDDHSDNQATNGFSVFSVDKPKILKPLNNHFTTGDSIDFIIVDVGNYIGQNFSYKILIDTTYNFNSSYLISSPILLPQKGLVKWQIEDLLPNQYFWKAFIYSDQDTNASDIQTFSTSSFSGNGFLSKSTQLKTFITDNILFSEAKDGLLLNTELLPPRPGPSRLIDSILTDDISPDTTEITTCTTDGTYLYYAHISYYRFGGKSNIYKVGTGLNGSEKGHNYGIIPNVKVTIQNQIFYHSDGFLYVATGDDSTLLRVNIESGDTSRVLIPDKLLPSEDGLLHNGGFYLVSDGNYVYNLTPGYGNLRRKHVLRTFDPSNGWNKVREDIVFLGESEYGFTSFFIANGYVTTYEAWNSGYYRKYRLSDGFFEEEYLPYIYSLFMYCYTYDWMNNYLYCGLFLPNNVPHDFGFLKFAGTYKEAFGSLSSPEIGPARDWKDLSFLMEDTGSSGIYSINLFGKNSSSGWDTLHSNIPSYLDLTDINANDYKFLKIKIVMQDSSFGQNEPLVFKSLKINYDAFPELNLYPGEVLFSADSLLQGFPVEMSFKVDNIGYTQADSLKLDFYNNVVDTIFYSAVVNVPADSFVTVTKTISTNNLLYSAPVSPVNVDVVATLPIPEYYTFNNLSNGNFNVIRDSANPSFNITFDGRELIDGDIISSEPEVVITLEDNSPLPIDSTYFTLVHTHNNIPKILNIPGPDITFEYTPYPNSKAVITWKPKLEDGKHILEVLAKDASGNFFDSTSSRSVFNVYNNPDLLHVFNYPNPFKDNTHFTFELRGIIPPEEFKIKIFTVAGRLIRVIDVPTSSLQIGFNKIYWDGRDEDGDEIANGLYFYKIISKHGDEVKTATQKLAKVK